MTLQKEEQMLISRLVELSNTASNRGIYTYSDFLNLNEQTILHENKREFGYCTIEEFGGYELAERKMFCFRPIDCYYEKSYPMAVLKIEAVNQKFSEELSHRDYLGAILNLGIDRSKVGDILVEFPCAYVFIEERMAVYVKDSLVKVRHTNVTATMIEAEDFHISPKFQEVKGSVSSLRLDAVLPIVFKGSRSSLTALIKGEKVFVNGKMIRSNSFSLKEEDVVSVRGHGKFIFKEVVTETKKGRSYILIYKYI